MAGAWGAGMDAVLFEMKKAHLAGARFGRTLLKPFGRALRYEASRIAVKLTDYFGWRLEPDLYVWDPGPYADLFDRPISETAHYELIVADVGMIDAPWFEAGDVLAEIEG
jgi:hypothetical protein